jgi:putative SOS response-associated peptidase YedK
VSTVPPLRQFLKDNELAVSAPLSSCLYNQIVTVPDLEFVIACQGACQYSNCMCGRYALAQDHEALKIRFGFIDDPTSPFLQTPRYNIAPSQMAAVITNGTGARLRGMRWGLIPHWAKDPSIGASLINARAETAPDKPSFRDAFKSKRCLIPATGFFEWTTAPTGKGKQPVYIRAKNQDIFSFAGLWSSWKDTAKGDEVLTYTILTTEPNDFMKAYHNRMPVILSVESEKVWISDTADKETLRDFFVPCPSELLEAYPVSTLVNSPRNDSPTCIEPLSLLM